MKLFLQALCICLVMEGIALALCPRLMRHALLELFKMPDSAWRALGCAALVCGAGLAFLLQFCGAAP